MLKKSNKHEAHHSNPVSSKKANFIIVAQDNSRSSGAVKSKTMPKIVENSDESDDNNESTFFR